jgi:hypothetical protein
MQMADGKIHLQTKSFSRPLSKNCMHFSRRSSRCNAEGSLLDHRPSSPDHRKEVLSLANKPQRHGPVLLFVSLSTTPSVQHPPSNPSNMTGSDLQAALAASNSALVVKVASCAPWLGQPSTVS